MTKIYWIPSTDMIHTPGMFRNCIHMWKTGDHKQAVQILDGLVNGRISIGTCLAILQGEYQYEVDGDTVIIRDTCAAQRIESPAS